MISQLAYARTGLTPNLSFIFQQNIMQTIKYFIYIAFGFLLMSCGEDFFDSITEVEIPEHEPQLVVRANFNPTFGEQNGYYVQLNHTLGILDTTDYKAVADATITLLEDNTPKADFIFEEGSGSGWYYTEPIPFARGKEYTLRATSPTYGSIEATQQLPSEVAIINATYEADTGVDIYGDRGDEVTIEFQDPAGEQNYYKISVLSSHLVESPDTSYLSNGFGAYTSPIDPIIEDLRQLYLTDASFDGEKFTARISVELMESGGYEYDGTVYTYSEAEKISVRLTSITKDEYLFEKTISAYQDNEDNPFAEPVVIHENVEGGSGIFTLSVTDEFPIEL